jgi:hypothetical protein
MTAADLFSYPPLEGKGRREPGDAKHRPESGGMG